MSDTHNPNTPKARLEATTGPRSGSSWLLESSVLTVGRDPTNHIVLDDPLVSRRHCRIVPEQDGFRIEDLESYNQTFVNGLPVTSMALRSGDQIHAGRSTLSFVLEGVDAHPVAPVVIEDDDGAASSALEETQPRQWFRMPEAPAEAVGDRPGPQLATPRRQGDLEVLFEISRSLGRCGTLDELCEALFDLIGDALPAERGAVLLDPFGAAASPEFSFAHVRNRGAKGTPFRISQTLVSEVLGKDRAVLSKYIVDNRKLTEAESLRRPEVESFVCVPIRETRGVIGVVYLDSRKPDAFDEQSLELLAAVAGVVAAPLENLRRLEWWEARHRQEENETITYNMVGETEPMRRVRDAISKVAGTDATVLILGETGTGKELVARAIHNASARAERRFADINCANLRPELVEVELFGSEHGAFTGAVKRKGQLETANGGTLFLDEVGELEPRSQAALLRVLETGQFQRVGGTSGINVDVRLVAATNVDLRQAVREGKFREDLFHRLNVFKIDVPPLRDRRADIPIMAAYFAKKSAAKYKRTIEGLTGQARRCLLSYDWPGNIRELQNAVERAVITAVGDLIDVADFPVELVQVDRARQGEIPRLYEAVNEATCRVILEAVESANGRVSEAATWLGIHPNNLHRLIARHNLKADIERIRNASAGKR
jgi:Nif-specific regulatory protein